MYAARIGCVMELNENDLSFRSARRPIVARFPLCGAGIETWQVWLAAVELIEGSGIRVGFEGTLSIRRKTRLREAAVVAGEDRVPTTRPYGYLRLMPFRIQGNDGQRTEIHPVVGVLEMRVMRVAKGIKVGVVTCFAK